MNRVCVHCTSIYIHNNEIMDFLHTLSSLFISLSIRTHVIQPHSLLSFLSGMSRETRPGFPQSFPITSMFLFLRACKVTAGTFFSREQVKQNMRKPWNFKKLCRATADTEGIRGFDTFVLQRFRLGSVDNAYVIYQQYMLYKICQLLMLPVVQRKKAQVKAFSLLMQLPGV